MSKSRFVWTVVGGAGLFLLGLVAGKSQQAFTPGDRANPALAQDPLDPASYDPNTLVARLATSRSPQEQAVLLEALSRGTPAPGIARDGSLRVGTEAWRSGGAPNARGAEADPRAFLRQVQADPLGAHRALVARSPAPGVPDPLASLPGGGPL